MKKSYILRISIAAVAALASLTGAAGQDLKTSFFLDGATMRHRMNPAFYNESNYFSFPTIGNFNFGVNATFGMSTFLFPYEGGLTTFMNPNISSEQFLRKLKDNNKLGVDLSMDILSFGFRGVSGGFNTFDISLRSSTSLNIPYDMFAFMKNGMTDAEGTRYNFKNFGVMTNNYLQASLGHSHYIIDNVLSIGVKAKFLVGIANIEARIKNAEVYMSQDKWIINGEGVINSSLEGLRFKTSPTGNGGEYISGAQFDQNNIGIAGYGFAIDLGAYYNMSNIVDGLAFSFSLTDLGMIKWNNTAVGEMANSFEFEGFRNPIGISDEDGLSGELDILMDDLKKFAHFEDKGIRSGRQQALTAKMYLGAEYTLPMFKPLKFGILNTTAFNGPYTWNETRFSANFSFVKAIDLAVNYAVGTYGSTLGWMVNFHPNGFNFFIGGDYITTSVSPQFIPINNANIYVNFGIIFTWGKNKIAEKLGKNKTE